MCVMRYKRCGVHGSHARILRGAGIASESRGGTVAAGGGGVRGGGREEVSDAVSLSVRPEWGGMGRRRLRLN